MLQRIERDNGEPFIGDYQTVVSKFETDCDTMPGEGQAAVGRFRHSFELHAESSGIRGIEHGQLVLIIEFHDSAGGSYREGLKFPDVKAVRDYCTWFDPCQRLPAQYHTPDEIELVQQRFNRRRQRFFEILDERFATPKNSEGQ